MPENRFLRLYDVCIRRLILDTERFSCIQIKFLYLECDARYPRLREACQGLELEDAPARKRKKNGRICALHSWVRLLAVVQGWGASAGV